MSAQNRYSFNPTIGAAGGIVDLAPYAIDTFINEANTGDMKFGMGVVRGSIPGTNIALPTEANAAVFEGVTTNNRTTEYDIEGKLALRKDAAVGVMRFGRIYARVSEGVTPAYGDALYLVATGENAGYFTNAAGSDTVAIKGRFLGTVDTSAGVAQIELFNQAQA